MYDPLVTLATPAAIIALVNLAKRFGLSGPWAALAAVVLGVTISLASWAFASEQWFTQAADGLILGLAAAGIWDITPTQPTPKRAADG